MTGDTVEVVTTGVVVIGVLTTGVVGVTGITATGIPVDPPMDVINWLNAPVVRDAPPMAESESPVIFLPTVAALILLANICIYAVLVLSHVTFDAVTDCMIPVGSRPRVNDT